MKTEYFERIDSGKDSDIEYYEVYRTSCGCGCKESSFDITLDCNDSRSFISIYHEMGYYSIFPNYLRALKDRFNHAVNIILGRGYKIKMGHDFIFKSKEHLEEYIYLLSELNKKVETLDSKRILREVVDEGENPFILEKLKTVKKRRVGNLLKKGGLNESHCIF